MRELRTHGDKKFPVAAYEWYGPEDAADDVVFECHWHEEWEFLSVFEGYTQISLNGEKRLIGENDVVLIPGHSLHTADCVGGCLCRYRSVVFAMPMLFGLTDDVVQEKYIAPIWDHAIYANVFVTGGQGSGEVVNTCFQKLFDAVSARPPAYELLVKGLFYELLAYMFPLMDLSKQAASGENLLNSTHCIKQAIFYMTENYAQPITITELADKANMSVGYFGKLFRKMTFYSPIDYLKNLRLSRAAGQLTASNDKIVTIAVDTGFNNVSYFIRAFTQKYGCTPHQYRLNARQTEARQTTDPF